MVCRKEGEVMAHSYQTPNGNRFIHSGDFSGDIRIITENGETSVPFEDLMAFVAERIRARKIEQLEAANINQILGI
jgi:hypothetical protein